MSAIKSTSSITVPAKKSRRLLQKSGCKEEEILETASVPFVTAKTRGTKIPIGLGHTHFPFHEQVSMKAIREQAKLEVKTAPTAKDNNVKVGEEYQADLPEFNPKLYDNDERDREEAMWTPSPKTFHDHESYQAAYFLPIWYQFEGQIPFEVALQNLMHHDYDIGKALETIDQKLKILPQKFKNLTKIQMKKFKELYDTKNKQGSRVEVPTRKFQEKAMRNYHIAETQNFYHFFENQALQGSSCTCPVLAHPEVVPRWACGNCTKHLKPTTSEDQCLICLNYKAVMGTTRPASNPVFTEDEYQKILDWKQIEARERRSVSKDEFEGIQKQKKIDRLLRNELTEEERLIIEPGQFPHKKKHLTEAQMQENGWNLVEQLEECPLGLPAFRQCNCDARDIIENPVALEIRKAIKRKSVDKDNQVNEPNPAKKPRRVIKR
ncbi:Protein CBG18733 [Caenorhabditis briggsae]|uniref:ELM2 domain-containing protein n=2 Tax=Caenorhabditis briggsae TaxID=6238 RepID=A0AAE9A6W0_CAEBR|nr:Protein CBG18733 [Caenorhabditis briggsae]ULT93569.1 hypothetical protein L3Y34_003218 [Caenorhabditis briggsae]CAP36131.1 Protein CBG18733 [Caenorhabditis briggsae]